MCLNATVNKRDSEDNLGHRFPPTPPPILPLEFQILVWNYLGNYFTWAIHQPFFFFFLKKFIYAFVLSFQTKIYLHS